MRSRRTPATTEVGMPEAGPAAEMPSLGPSNERAAAEMAVGGATSETSALDMAIATNGAGRDAHSGSDLLANTTTGRGQVGPYAVWTTGGGSSLLPRGNWGARDLRTHHSDRTASWAADRVREGRNIPYNSVDAYDLTFEKMDKNGNAIAGTARGLPLMTPVTCKIYDVQHSFRGSGGYGKFVILEYMEGDLAGERVQVSHMHTVERIQKGQVLKGGQIFGTQGGSGSKGPNDYDVHVDIVGTAPAVILFTKANQSGKFQTESTGPVAGEGRAPPAVAGSGEDGTTPAVAQVSPGMVDVAAGQGLLREGMTGDAVAELQMLLGLPPNGQFDTSLTAIVKQFQQSAGVSVAEGLEGTVGKATLEELRRG